MDEKPLCFPSYFPDGCPPNDVRTEELYVYRYCMTENITADDFLSYYQLNPEKYKDNIQAYGLSVLCDKQDCIKGLKLPGIKRRFKSFACGITYKNTGVIKKTPNKVSLSHCTWWLYDGVKPHIYFVVCT